MGFKRDIFTGELVETKDGPGGRQIIFRGALPFGAATVTGRASNPWARGTDHIDIGMSLKPEDATPERIEKENAEAKHHGTGAYYTPDGICHCPTRGTKNRELRRNNRQNNDAGFGDWAGR